MEFLTGRQCRRRLLRGKRGKQTAPCQGRLRTEIHRGFQAARPLSVLLPLHVCSSVSLKFSKARFCCQSLNLLYISFPLHLQPDVIVLLAIMEWKVVLIQTTVSAHSLNMDG